MSSRRQLEIVKDFSLRTRKGLIQSKMKRFAVQLDILKDLLLKMSEISRLIQWEIERFVEKLAILKRFVEKLYI